jgi:hypothetical protein
MPNPEDGAAAILLSIAPEDLCLWAVSMLSYLISDYYF